MGPEQHGYMDQSFYDHGLPIFSGVFHRKTGQAQEHLKLEEPRSQTFILCIVLHPAALRTIESNKNIFEKTCHLVVFFRSIDLTLNGIHTLFDTHTTAGRNMLLGPTPDS
jgi:hypothetical protein